MLKLLTATFLMYSVSICPRLTPEDGLAVHGCHMKLNRGFPIFNLHALVKICIPFPDSLILFCRISLTENKWACFVAKWIIFEKRKRYKA